MSNPAGAESGDRPPKPLPPKLVIWIIDDDPGFRQILAAKLSKVIERDLSPERFQIEDDGHAWKTVKDFYTDVYYTGHKPHAAVVDLYGENSPTSDTLNVVVANLRLLSMLRDDIALAIYTYVPTYYSDEKDLYAQDRFNKAIKEYQLTKVVVHKSYHDTVLDVEVDNVWATLKSQLGVI